MCNNRGSCLTKISTLGEYGERTVISFRRTSLRIHLTNLGLSRLIFDQNKNGYNYLFVSKFLSYWGVFSLPGSKKGSHATVPLKQYSGARQKKKTHLLKMATDINSLSVHSQPFQITANPPQFTANPPTERWSCSLAPACD
jgi:hypothetical protein